MATVGKKGFLYSNDKVAKYPDSYYFASANHIPEFPKQVKLELPKLQLPKLQLPKLK